MSLIHCGLNHFSVVTGGVARSCDGCSMRGGPHGGAGQVSSECPQLTWPEPVHPALPRDSPTSPCIMRGI
ncbi:hypothetical protein J4Q44_G00074070 [Coregonus suidteri]|uniref:Uncharacterized protein n=1 Tax=Coregonus suidteri TaxID=861788 RepID=A0AAN8MF02_9TELE